MSEYTRGLEDAAKIAEAKARHYAYERQHETVIALHRGLEIAEETAEEIAAAIRAAKEKQP